MRFQPWERSWTAGKRWKVCSVNCWGPSRISGLEQLAVHHADKAVIVECKFGGPQRGVWAGIAPTGNRMEVQSALIFVFENENLVCEKVYFDHATVLRQIGVESA